MFLEHYDIRLVLDSAFEQARMSKFFAWPVVGRCRPE